MKKLISLTIIFLVAFYFVSKNDSQTQSDEWVTYTNEDNGIQSHKTTDIEKHIAKITPQKKTKGKRRKPASVNKRNLTLLPDQASLKDLEVKNEVHKEWRKRMATNLMRFQDEETKLLVNKLESMVILDKGKGLNVEKVHVKYITKSGRHYGFHALVNSETGHVIRTWNRIHHEGIGHQRIKLSPSNLN